jgi:hypothetical protein
MIVSNKQFSWMQAAHNVLHPYTSKGGVVQPPTAAMPIFHPAGTAFTMAYNNIIQICKWCDEPSAWQDSNAAAAISCWCHCCLA